MFRTLMFTLAAVAMQPDGAKAAMRAENAKSAEPAVHQHDESPDAAHQGHESHDHGAAHDGDGHAAKGDIKGAGERAMTRTPAIEAALADGGQPVVADLLGVVCDFCATALNKTFGKRPEVAATFVDLDRKTLSLVLRSDATLSDDEIAGLVKRSGYRLSQIRRGGAALSGATP